MTRGAEGPSAREWDVWQGAAGGDGLEAYADLASYVVDERYRGRGFGFVQTPDGTPASVGRASRALYERFAHLGLPYRLPAWTLRGQWIKDPEWFRDESGTCLDFAVTFAAGCLANSIPVLLAVTEGPDPHAFVVVDTTRGLTTPETVRQPMLDGSFGGDATVRVRTAASRDQLRALCGPEDLGCPVALDVTWASRGPYPAEGLPEDPVVDASAASEAAWRSILASDAVVLVDVARVKHQSSPNFTRVPFGDGQRRRPAITTLIPDVDVEGFVPQTGVDRAVAALLAGDRAGLVLHGRQGAGKSLAALVAAQRTEDRAGWFLNATDQQALVDSLARNELAQRQLPDSRISTGEDARSFAGLALERLSRQDPWLVVLDNAESGPAQLGEFLPRPAAGWGQRLIVTTTQASWAHWAQTGGRDQSWEIRDPSLGPDEVAAFGLSAEAAHLADGRALFLAAFRRLGSDVVRAALAAEPRSGSGEDVDPAARLLWLAARGQFGPDDGLLRPLAAAASWMQPDEIDVRLLCSCADIETDQGLIGIRRLVELGVLTRFDQAVRMHRLVGQAVRATLPAAQSLAVLSRSAWEEHARQRADGPLLSAAEKLLRAARPREDAAVDVASLRPWLAAARGQLAALEPRGKASDAAPLARQLVKAVERLGIADDELSEEVARQLAEALHILARAVNQASRGRSEAPAAINEYVDREQRLWERLSDVRGVSASVTMRGLLQLKTASTLEAVLAARTVLEQARDERIARIGEIDLDTARGVFNLGGPNVRLAKMYAAADDPEGAGDCLDQAAHAYGRALEIRNQLFGYSANPFKAASYNGLGMVAYYRALLTTQDPQERTALLRAASGHAAQAAAVRQTLDGGWDGNDTMKSVDLLGKISRVRRLTANAVEAQLEAERWAERAETASDAGRIKQRGIARAAAEGARALENLHVDVSQEAASAGLVMPATRFDLAPGVSVWCTGRAGGFSAGGELNMGDHIGDDSRAVYRNRELVRQFLDVGPIAFPELAHSGTVAVVRSPLAGAGYVSHEQATLLLPQTDALVTDCSRIPLGVLAADCAPVIAYDAARQALGLAHVGYRGVIAGVLPNLLATMTAEFGTEPANVRVFIGPHIRYPHFKLAAAEAARFGAATDPGAAPADPLAASEAVPVDLTRAIRRQLAGAGVPDEHLSDCGVDTVSSCDEYFSETASLASPPTGAKQPPRNGRFAAIAWLNRQPA